MTVAVHPTSSRSPAPAAPIVEIRTVLVTVDMAREWLRSNAEENRHVRETRGESYARDMKEGRWQLTGEAIKIDVNGVLIDGQHRLNAVVMAGVSVYMVVCTNLPHEAMAVLDSGLSRTFGDKLKGSSGQYRNQIASVVRKIYYWDRGDMTIKGSPPTHAELLDAFDRDPAGYTAAAMHGNDVARQRICSASTAGTAFYLFSRLDGERALQFFDQLKTGANLPDGHPVLTVRNRLSRAQQSRDAKLSPQDKLALLVRAWNAFRSGRELDRILIAKGALSNANFPIPL